MKKIILFIIFFYGVESISAQNFEGYIVYQSSINRDSLAKRYPPFKIQAKIADMYTFTMHIAYKNGIAHWENKVKETYSIVLPDSFIGINTQKKEITKTLRKKNLTYKHTCEYIAGETKDILGYTCQKAFYTLIDTKYPKYSTTYLVYYTTLLPPIYNSPFEKLNGCALYFEVIKGTTYTTCVATEIKHETIPDSLFQVPEGYKYKDQ